MKRIGICKLTGMSGRLVRSHLIPNALTRLSRTGSPFIQGGDGEPPERRWSSWYDTQLVTEEGEEILALLDNWAISTLRAHRLVWSGWGPIQTLQEGIAIADKGWRARE